MSSMFDNPSVMRFVHEAKENISKGAQMIGLGLTNEQAIQISREFLEMMERHDIEQQALIDKANAWVKANEAKHD